MKYKFIPNDLAREMFHLKKKSYTGKGLTPLLEKTLGQENFDRHVVAQDPMPGSHFPGRTGIIRIKGDQSIGGVCIL